MEEEANNEQIPGSLPVYLPIRNYLYNNYYEIDVYYYDN